VESSYGSDDGCYKYIMSYKIVFRNELQYTVRNRTIHAIAKDIFSTLLVLLPILDIYSLNIVARRIGLGTLITFAYGALLMMMMRKKNRIANRESIRALWMYYGFGVAVTLLVAFTSSVDTLTLSIVMMLFYIIILVFFSPKFLNIKMFEKIYHTVVFAACIYLLLQHFFFYVFHIALSCVLPSVPLFSIPIESSSFISSYKAGVLSNTTRMSSFFTEPAHLALYVVPYICILLFSKSRKRNVVQAVFISFCVILSRSSLGIAMMFLTWLLWSFHSLTVRKESGSKRARNSLYVIVIGAPFVIFTVIYMYNVNQSFRFAIDRILAVINGQSDSSSALRITRGFVLFSQFDFINKLIGVGFGNVGLLNRLYRFSDIYEAQFVMDNAVGYMSGISRLFYSTGIIGVMLYTRFLMKVARNSGFLIKNLILVIAMALFASDTLFSTYSTLWLSICVFCSSNEIREL